MFRKHGEEYVVKTIEVWPLIPAHRQLTEQEEQDPVLVRLYNEYQEFLAAGGIPLEAEKQL